MSDRLVRIDRPPSFSAVAVRLNRKMQKISELRFSAVPRELLPRSTVMRKK